MRIYIYDDVEDRYELHPDENDDDARMAEFLSVLMEDFEKGELHDLRHEAAEVAHEVLGG